jgi:hypothetical protein
LAFEYNGLYFHSEEFKEKTYHYDKWKLCNDNGIKLVNVWEDDWLNKRSIVESMINNQLHVNNVRVYARNTTIKEISAAEAVEFFNTNHLQGSCIANTTLGLYTGDRLVSAMSFGKSRMIMKTKHIQNEYELLRFCNITNTSVVGGASKLFKHFLCAHNPTRVITYSSCDMGTGNLYKTLGFDFVRHTGINYWWVLNGKRHHRSNFMKYKLVKMGYDKNKTADDIMHERKAVKLYGTGNMRWEYVNQKSAV